MQQEPLATLACGGISTSRHNHLSYMPYFASHSCMRCFGGTRKGMIPHSAGLVLAAQGILFAICSSLWGPNCLVGATAQRPSAHPEVPRALSLARDITSRRINFRNSPYGEHSGLKMKFSRSALNDLAERLFPKSEDALKKQKFLALASRIDLTNQVLDLSTAHRIKKVRDALDRTTTRFGFAAGRSRNPLGFPDAVRTVFHSFVNKQQLKAMAELHTEEPTLATRLEGVDVTPELRHLIASALPAVQPSKTTAEEKAALVKTALFYRDLGATRQRLLGEAKEKVDTTTPLPTASTHAESSPDQAAATGVKEVIKKAHKEARQRVSDAYQKMSPQEKRDFAAVGLTTEQLTGVVFRELLKNAIMDSSANVGNDEAVKKALDEVTPKPQTDYAARRYRKMKRSLTALTLLAIVAITSTFMSWKQFHEAKRKRAGRRRRPKIEEASLDLNLEELASMPLPALKEKAYARTGKTWEVRNGRGTRKRIKAENDAGTTIVASKNTNVEAVSHATVKHF